MSDSEKQASSAPTRQVPLGGIKESDEQSCGKGAQRDCGYGGSVSSTITPHFSLGAEEMFNFDEEQERVATGRSITDVFPSMETAEGHHHPYDIGTPLSPEPEGQGSRSRPVDIPCSQHSQRHDNFTPPRGYIRAHHRYSTGSMPPRSGLQTQRSVQTQTPPKCSSSHAQDMVDNAVKFQEGLLQHTEQRLLKTGRVKRRQRQISVGASEEELMDEQEGDAGDAALAAAVPPQRGRSKSVPTLPKSALEKLYGQELRRIADEFHCSNICLEELYHRPSSNTHIDQHASSYPHGNGHQRGWWQHIIQYISPRRRSTSFGSPATTSVPSASTADQLPESDSETE